MEKFTNSDHFIERFRERIAKTSAKRIYNYAARARFEGIPPCSLKDSNCRWTYMEAEKSNGSSIRIYKNTVFIYSKDLKTAITCYKLGRHKAVY